MTRVAQMREAAARWIEENGIPRDMDGDDLREWATAIRALPDPPKPTHEEVARELSAAGERLLLDGNFDVDWLAVTKRAEEIYG